MKPRLGKFLGRRRRLHGQWRLAVVLACCWMCFGLMACRTRTETRPMAATSPPNVVLIVSDDHAWTDYGFMGHPHIRTPNLDRLAAQSLMFTRGYVPASLCCPSLAS